MNILSIIMAAFAALGALDLIIGNKLGLGGEFKKGIFMLGEITLAMAGMLVLSPLFAQLLAAPLGYICSVLPVDPSAFVACLLANDMGGADLSFRLSLDPQLGGFNGLVLSSMMGATFSFTLPYIMGATKKEQRSPILLGVICGVCTIPAGCLAAGLICGIGIPRLLLDLSPALVLSAVCTVGLLACRNISLKVFNIIGIAIRSLAVLGLAVGILEYLLGLDILPHTASIEDVAKIIFPIAAVMAGAFPLLFTVTKLLKKPLAALGRRTGLCETSLVGFIATLATSVTTFGMMDEMDERGVTLNSAFAVSGAFLLADHMAFTMAYDPSYLLPMMVGKLISGAAAVAVALLITARNRKKN